MGFGVDADKLDSGRNGHEMNDVSLDLVTNQVTIKFNMFSSHIEFRILSYFNGRKVVPIKRELNLCEV